MAMESGEIRHSTRGSNVANIAVVVGRPNAVFRSLRRIWLLFAQSRRPCTSVD